MRTKAIRVGLSVALMVGAAVAVAVVPSAASATSATAGTASATSAASGTATTVAIDASANNGRVNPAVLGQAYLWPFGGMGSFNDATNQFYPQFLSQLTKTVQPGSLRYPGGITAEVFHWQRAVGPTSARTDNAFGPSDGPSPSSVGPDEFGELLDRTKSAGVVTANFGTGTAAEAAAFVAYMTGAPGSSKWADLRVKNGHRAPYQVPYWEVGNEEYSANFWRTGTPVTVGGPAGACQNVATCLYIYGGSTSFANQAVVGYADRTANASLATGNAGQGFYVAYPPVAAGSATVAVAGTAWTQTDSLATAGPDDEVYTINNATGQISFGDGVHGALPPAGAKITASYVSGPHDGFLDFYAQMKAANPAIQVCSTDTTDDFIASMGSALPYDCLQQHSYTQTTTVANNAPIDTYQDQMIAGADNEAATVAGWQARLRAASGRDPGLVETEYGQLLNSSPDADPTYHQSLDQALLNASQLANFIRLDIPVADRQLLAAEIPPADNCCAGLPDAAPFAGTASIGTPGPDTVLQATGQLYHLFAPLAGGTVLGVQTIASPALPAAPRTPALSVLAVRAGGAVEVLVINRDTTNDVAANLVLQGVQATGRASYQRLDGPSSLSVNTADAPNTVRLTSGSLNLHGSTLPATFPAHSVTTLRLPVVPTPPQGLSLALTGDAFSPAASDSATGAGATEATSTAAPIAPGTSVTLNAAIANSSNADRHGTLSFAAAAGWTVTPSTVDYSLAGHAATSVDVQVSVPADAAEAPYTLGGLLTAQNGTVNASSYVDTIVRSAPACGSADCVFTPVATDDFEDQTVGAPPSDYTVACPAGGVTVQASPSGPGQVLQLQRPAGGTGLISADRTVAPISGQSQFVFSALAAQTDTALGVQLLDATGTPVVKFTLATGGDVGWSNPTDFVRGATYDADTWHTYEIDPDPAAGTYQFFIDNVLTATAALNTAAGPVADIHLQIPASPATPGTFDIDDISLSVPAS